ncbi:MAG TPA: GH1 family beta-glucosidase [Polyangiaceae bacterium]|jgi:beta-glucosidase
MEPTRSDFGKDFLFGVATSSYQIEGAVQEDGRGPSIWDRFAHMPGKVKGGHTGDVACDHYHRMPEDVELMAWLGVNAYRFSICWPRVLPSGRGAVNERGLDFYDRLVDALCARGIAPCATLYHWDFPDTLAGGWLERSSVGAFVEYAELMAKRLGDRVALWLTHNEPWCQAFLGYETGLFAPGHRSLSDALLCAHHLLLSHGECVRALRALVKAPLGFAPNFMPAHPLTSEPIDVAAAARQDGYFNRWFIEPALGRGYPADMVAWYGANMPTFPSSDLDTIAAPIDVVGVNYYERAVIAHDAAGGMLQLKHVRDTGLPRTADREIYPAGLGEVLRRLHGEYGVGRLMITENGAAYPDECTPSGVHDDGRIAFLRAHLAEVLAARRAGVNVAAYFAWSLLDNFEWSEGYGMRYGLVHVDFDSQKRTPKDSAIFYRQFLGR